MPRWLKAIRLSQVNSALLVFGLAVLVTAIVGPKVTVNGVHIGPGASALQRSIVAAVGFLAIAWAVVASVAPARELRTDQGFVGARPRLPVRLVERPDLLRDVVRALCAQDRLVAVAGIGGAGKSTLAARACADRRVRRAFRDGITWLDTGPRQGPEVLLASLAHRLGLTQAATGFATVEQGRDYLAAALRGKRMLIAIDNVWERHSLDAFTDLAPTCTVLFTTRLTELAKVAGARPILVDELSKEQALELLGRWTNQAPSALPDAARKLCARVGNLALGVAMAGAMIAQGRSFTDLLTSIDLDPSQVGADLDPEYRYRTLFDTIEASVTDLPEDAQRQYAQLAVFAGRSPFPGDAAAALWQPELPEVEVGRRLAELIGRSLLTAEGDDWYSAHDLQYEFLTRRLGAAGLTAAHLRLLKAYRIRYPGGWADSANDAYLAHTLAGHLHDAGLDEELHATLTDAAWIQARLTHGRLPDLVLDFRYADDALSRQILRALQLSAGVVVADPTLVRSQLAGRLVAHPDPAIKTWYDDLIIHSGPPAWLAPLTAALIPVTDPLTRVLTLSHLGGTLAVTADGARAVSGGGDGTVRVWDLATDREQAVLTGHQGGVSSVAVTADAVRAVSGGHDDGTVRVWDLATGRAAAVLTGHQGGVSSVAVTADGATAVSGGRDGTVRVWDLATDREQAVLTGHQGGVSSVAVTADAVRAVSGGHDDGTVRVWDLATGRAAAVLTGHQGGVSSVAVTADGAHARSAAAVTGRCGCGTWLPVELLPSSLAIKVG